MKWFNDVLAKDFEAKHPGIRIAVTTVGWDTRKERLTVSVAAGSGPDIYTVGSGYAAFEGMEGIALPLDRYLAKWTEKGQFYPRLWDTMKYKGKTYGVPNLVEVRGVVVNTELMARAGIQPELALKSREGMLLAAKKTTVTDGVKGLVQAGYTTMWDIYTHQDYIMYLLSSGNKFIDDDMRDPAFGDKLGIEAAKFMTDLYHTTHPVGVKVPGSYDMGLFLDEKAAMIRGMQMTMVLARNKSAALAKRIALYPIQYSIDTKPITVGWVNGLAITKQSKMPDVAFDFIKTMCSAKYLWKLNSLIGGCSPRRDSLPIAEEQNDIFIPWYKQLPSAAVYPNFPELAELQGTLDAALGKCYKSKASPEKAIPSAAADWKKSLTRYWSTGGRKAK